MMCVALSGERTHALGTRANGMRAPGALDLVKTVFILSKHQLMIEQYCDE
jgi:hypothetical protein